MGRFTNKIVVITGGTSGIGLAAAIQFIKEGAKVVKIERRPQPRIELPHSILWTIPLRFDSMLGPNAIHGSDWYPLPGANGAENDTGLEAAGRAPDRA
jgi:hypothetical protein